MLSDNPVSLSVATRRTVTSLMLLLICIFSADAQENASTKHLPIIDVHVHAMKVNPAFANDMCPWFLSSMPGGDPTQAPPSFLNLDCADPLKAAKTDQEMQDAVLATMKRLNMTIVAYGDPGIIRKWMKAAPGRVIPGIGVSSSKDMTVKAFQDSLSSGFYSLIN